MQTNPRTAAAAVLAALAAVAALALAHSGPQERQGATVASQRVAGNVWVLTGRGGNIGLSVGPDGVLMVDDQFRDLAPEIRAEIDRLHAQVTQRDSGGGEALKWVLNTHHHGDHTGGNPVFGELAPILAHENVRRRLLAPGRGEPMAEAGLPVLTYAEGVSLHFNGEELRVEHVPGGHTDGDSVIWFTGSNAVHLGDQFFMDRFPFVDLDSGGSVSQLAKNVEGFLQRMDDATRIIPGHGGPIAGRADLARYHDMLVDVLARVEEALAAGKTLEELQRDDLLADYSSWSWPFIPADRFLETIVRELSGR